MCKHWGVEVGTSFASQHVRRFIKLDNPLASGQNHGTGRRRELGCPIPWIYLLHLQTALFPALDKFQCKLDSYSHHTIDMSPRGISRAFLDYLTNSLGRTDTLKFSVGYQNVDGSLNATHSTSANPAMVSGDRRLHSRPNIQTSLCPVFSFPIIER